jgi:hypothetical protein
MESQVGRVISFGCPEKDFGCQDPLSDYVRHAGEEDAYPFPRRFAEGSGPALRCNAAHPPAQLDQAHAQPDTRSRQSTDHAVCHRTALEGPEAIISRTGEMHCRSAPQFSPEEPMQ